MVKKKGTQSPRFVEGMLQDADTIFNAIVEKIGTARYQLTRTKKYDSCLFFNNTDGLKQRKPKSHKMEKAFNDVYKSYLKHQNIWVDDEQEAVFSDQEPDSDLELSTHDIDNL
jgi:hypothetical protein